MGYALLFAGQGSQHAGMLPWLERVRECDALLAVLADTLGSDWRTRLNDRDWATSNRVAQPLIVGTTLAAWAALSARLASTPVCVAGYSVGELSAYAAAGVCTPALALELAARRAMLMDEAVRGLCTGLLSIARVSEDEVLARCPDLETSIRIDRDHGLYAGTVSALAAAERELGGRADCKRIDVALASHSSWMRSAAAGFARELEELDIRSAACPVATNATGAATRDRAFCAARSPIRSTIRSSGKAAWPRWPSAARAACSNSGRVRRSPACGRRNIRIFPFDPSRTFGMSTGRRPGSLVIRSAAGCHRSRTQVHTDQRPWLTINWPSQGPVWHKGRMPLNGRALPQTHHVEGRAAQHRRPLCRHIQRT